VIFAAAKPTDLIQSSGGYLLQAPSCPPPAAAASCSPPSRRVGEGTLVPLCSSPSVHAFAASCPSLSRLLRLLVPLLPVRVCCSADTFPLMLQLLLRCSIFFFFLHTRTASVPAVAPLDCRRHLDRPLLYHAAPSAIRTQFGIDSLICCVSGLLHLDMVALLRLPLMYPLYTSPAPLPHGCVRVSLGAPMGLRYSD
jgi:hypothetical protein